MAALLCSNNHLFNFDAVDREPTAVCPTCHEHVATGSEEKIRAAWEQSTAYEYPRVTAARSIALSNSIYKTALKGRGYVSMTTAQRKLNKEGYHGELISCELVRGREHGGLKQDSCTAAVVAIINRGDNPRISIYVVFRGSASAESVGGWVDQRKVNLDWRANFDNRMATTDYAAPDVRIHKGFKDVLGSYRDEVRRTLNEMRRRAESAMHQHHTVITGHSQGAAHALLFAHWLSYVDPNNRVFCMPFSPPRVGDYTFARDFTSRITERAVFLPYDGWRPQSAFLMVKGLDPVSFDQKRAFGPQDDNRRNQKIDKYNLYQKANRAGKWESEQSVAEQPYFHPKHLVLLSSAVPKVGMLKAFDHQPWWFRNKILRNL